MWAFSIYTGADNSTIVLSQGEPYSLGIKVVLDFAKLLEAGHPWIFYLDNFFTSVRLLVDLKCQYGIYATSTANIWSQMFPRPLAAQYTKIKSSERHLRVGDVKTRRPGGHLERHRPQCHDKGGFLR